MGTEGIGSQSPVALSAVRVDGDNKPNNKKWIAIAFMVAGVVIGLLGGAGLYFGVGQAAYSYAAIAVGGAIALTGVGLYLWNRFKKQDPSVVQQQPLAPKTCQRQGEGVGAEEGAIVRSSRDQGASIIGVDSNLRLNVPALIRTLQGFRSGLPPTFFQVIEAYAKREMSENERRLLLPGECIVSKPKVQQPVIEEVVEEQSEEVEEVSGENEDYEEVTEDQVPEDGVQDGYRYIYTGDGRILRA